MKTLTIVLGLFLATAVIGQQESAKISFKREKQAIKQVNRLNIYHAVYSKNSDGSYSEKKLTYSYCDGRFCVDIVADDFELKYGRLENRNVIRKRHYLTKKIFDKRIVNPDPIGFGYDIERLKYNKFKLFKK